LLTFRSQGKEKFLLVSFLLSFLFSLPQAEAKFFTMFEKILGKTTVSSSSGLSSQVLPLLSAPLNSNLLAGTGGGEVSIVQNSAILPMTGPLGSMADVQENKSDAISLYLVREGDTISEIAELFDVTPNTIRWANNLKGGGLISPGQVLVILPVSGLQYKVQKGDTVASIVKKFGGDTDEILSFNDLSSSSGLTVGTTLIIPNGEAQVIVQAPTKPKSIASKASGPSYQGYYARPISGGIRTQGIHGYNGVDLANSCGTPIAASAAGNVLIARSSGWNSGYGQYVVVGHPNGTQTLYAHMNGIVVAPGWEVYQGQILGYLGTTGLSTGCHIHFEVRGARNPF